MSTVLNSPEHSDAGTENSRPKRETSRDLELILRLLEALQSGEARGQGARQFARLLSQILPENHVVLAIGSAARCSIVIDGALGVLALDTPSARRVRDLWSEFGKASGESTYWQLPLSGNANQTAWLLIENQPELSERLREVLGRSSRVFAQVLWSRQARSFGLRTVWENQDNRQRIALSALVLTLLMLFPTPYRVGCTTLVEPLQQRLIAAPFDAQLDECSVQPGDSVAAGEKLCQLDGRPLRIEREALLADLAQARKEHDVALAGNKVADAQIAQLERDRLQHQIDLISERLESLTIRCPISGVVVSGDLRKAQGMPFAMGDPMFEVAPLDAMTFEIEIPEMDIGYVSAGSGVRVRIAALGRSVEGKLERVYPKSEVRDDRNVFIGVLEIENNANDLRPGMEGSAVIYGPYRPFAWRWLRRGYEGFLQAIDW